ncbi:MAG: hypothetical protein OXU77_21340 [Gammaproteobacteria bacterium]|nr:hypothetical protein [Gammaproteobacteria bacterium]
MFKKLYDKVDALCKAHPKAMAWGMVVFVTVVFLVNPATWKWPAFTAWIAAAVLLPVPFQVWAMVRRKRRESQSEV